MADAALRTGGIAVILIAAGLYTAFRSPAPAPHALAGAASIATAVPDLPALPAYPTGPTADPVDRAPVVVNPAVAVRRDVPLLKALAGKGPRDRSVLDVAMATQDRVVAKAAPMEDAMRNAVLAIPTLSGGADPVRVTCVTTTCEVTGTAPAGRSALEVEQALRDPAFLETVVRHGYSPGPATVADTGNGTIGFILYLNDEM
jgi:hypothetical protein